MVSNKLSPHRDEKPISKGTFTKLKESILMKNTPVEETVFRLSQSVFMTNGEG